MTNHLVKIIAIPLPQQMKGTEGSNGRNHKGLVVKSKPFRVNPSHNVSYQLKTRLKLNQFECMNTGQISRGPIRNSLCNVRLYPSMCKDSHNFTVSILKGTMDTQWERISKSGLMLLFNMLYVKPVKTLKFLVTLQVL